MRGGGVIKGAGPKKPEFDEAAIRRMKRLRADGVSDRAIGNGFGVSSHKVIALIGPKGAP